MTVREFEPINNRQRLGVRLKPLINEGSNFVLFKYNIYDFITPIFIILHIILFFPFYSLSILFFMLLNPHIFNISVV